MSSMVCKKRFMVLFVVFLCSSLILRLSPLLCFIAVFFFIICVSLWCFTNEVRTPLRTEHMFIICSCINNKSEVSREYYPPPHSRGPNNSLPTRTFQGLCSSVFVRQWFHMWRLFCHYLFLMSPSLFASGLLCLEIVAFCCVSSFMCLCYSYSNRIDTISWAVTVKIDSVSTEKSNKKSICSQRVPYAVRTYICTLGLHQSEVSRE